MCGVLILPRRVVTGNKMIDFARSEEGTTLIEYAVVAMLIAMAVVGVLVTIGGRMTGLYQSVSGAFP